MKTTVTCMCRDHEHAVSTKLRLVGAGYAPLQMRIVEAATPDRLAFIALRTRDGWRAAILGAVFAGIGGIAAGAVLGLQSGVLEAAVVGGGVAIVCGSLIGTFVGLVTAHLMNNEIERMLQAGTVLVSVTSDAAHGSHLMGLMVGNGGAKML